MNLSTKITAFLIEQNIVSKKIKKYMNMVSTY